MEGARESQRSEQRNGETKNPRSDRRKAGKQVGRERNPTKNKYLLVTSAMMPRLAIDPRPPHFRSLSPAKVYRAALT
jgi:hypothetical protein